MNLNGSKFLFFAYLVIPWFFLTGSFLPDLTIAIVSLYFILFIIYFKIYYLINSKYIIFYFIWLFYLIFCSLLANDTLLSFESTLFYIRFIIFSLAAFYAIKNISDFQFYLFYSLLALMTLMTFDGYFQFFFGFNIFGFEYKGYRLSSFFNDELILGNYLSKISFFFLSVYFLTNKKNIIINYYSLFLLISIFGLIILSGERTSLFFYLLGVIMILVFINIKFLYKLFFAFCLLFVFTSIIYFNNSIQSRLFDLTKSEIFNSEKNFIPITYLPLYLTSKNIFVDNPIFGIGPKNFRVICENKKYNVSIEIDSNAKYTLSGCSTHPHNTYIQLLTETGIIGASPVFLIFIYIVFLLSKHIFYLVRYRKKIFDNSQIVILIYYFLILFPFLPTNSFFNNRNSIMIYLPMPLLLYIFANKFFNEKNKL